MSGKARETLTPGFKDLIAALPEDQKGRRHVAVEGKSPLALLSRDWFHVVASLDI